MLLKLTTIAAAFLIWVPVAQAWSWPVQGPVLQKFDYDSAHPYAAGQHRGIDIGAPAAGDQVVAPASGTVSFAGSVPTNGKCVTIETPDGYSVTLTHLGAISVSKGASVVEGAVVGTVGPSGTPDFAQPYVHLGIRLSADPNGYVDPLGLLPALAPPPPDTGGTSSSGSAGVPAGSGDGSASSSDPGSTTPTVSDPAPVATPKAAPGGAGLVIRARAGAGASAPAAAPSVERAHASSAAPKRPTHKAQRVTESVSEPRTHVRTLEEPTVARPALPSSPPARRAAQPEATPAGNAAFMPDTLAAAPGILATIAALMTGLRRRRRRPPAVVVRYPLRATSTMRDKLRPAA